jgi:hypothetical protein
MDIRVQAIMKSDYVRGGLKRKIQTPSAWGEGGFEYEKGHSILRKRRNIFIFPQVIHGYLNYIYIYIYICIRQYVEKKHTEILTNRDPQKRVSQ